eukprot:3659125-Rhodomonas_salina.1
MECGWSSGKDLDSEARILVGTEILRQSLSKRWACKNSQHGSGQRSNRIWTGDVHVNRSKESGRARPREIGKRSHERSGAGAGRYRERRRTTVKISLGSLLSLTYDHRLDATEWHTKGKPI